MPELSEELVEILVCPETRQPLKRASADQLEAINARIRDGSARTRGGNKVEKELTDGLVREDGGVVYAVDDGIPVMLVEESFELA